MVSRTHYEALSANHQECFLALYERASAELGVEHGSEAGEAEIGELMGEWCREASERLDAGWKPSEELLRASDRSRR